MKMSQCEYILANGERCKRNAQSVSKFCWQHTSFHLYFSLLPRELIEFLFLYFNSNELLLILPEIEKISDLAKILTSKTFWKAIWKRDISSFLSPPSSSENPYEKYKEIFQNLSKYSLEYNKIFYLAVRGYDR